MWCTYFPGNVELVNLTYLGKYVIWSDDVEVWKRHSSILAIFGLFLWKFHRAVMGNFCSNLTRKKMGEHPYRSRTRGQVRQNLANSQLICKAVRHKTWFFFVYKNFRVIFIRQILSHYPRKHFNNHLVWHEYTLKALFP